MCRPPAARQRLGVRSFVPVVVVVVVAAALTAPGVDQAIGSRSMRRLATSRDKVEALVDLVMREGPPARRPSSRSSSPQSGRRLKVGALGFRASLDMHGAFRIPA